MLHLTQWFARQLPAMLLATAVILSHTPSAAQTNEDRLPVAQPAASVETAQLKREIANLQDLLKGTLPALVSLSALFEIDLTDEAAVDQRRQALQERQAATPNPQPGTNGDNPVTLRLERDRLRLAFLQLPAMQRSALLEQDRLQRKGQVLATEQRNSAEAHATAELARDNALTVASRTTDDVKRVLATEEARLLAHLSEMASLRQIWATRNQALLAEHEKLIARYADVDSRTKLEPKQADRLYQTIRTDLRSTRAEADAALNSLAAPSVIRPMGKALPLTDAAYAPYPDALQRIRLLHAKIAQEEAELPLRESAERYAGADEIMRTLRALQARRIALLPMLSVIQRDAATGFTSEGFDRIVSEVTHVHLMLRWYPVQRMHDAKSFASLLNNVFVAGRFGIDLLGLLLLLGAVFVVLRHGRSWLGRLRIWLSLRVQPRTLMLRVDGAMQMLMRMTNELLLLFTVYLIFDRFFNAAQAAPEWAALRRLAYAYAYYALALAFIHRVMLVAVSRYRVVPSSLNEKILKSLRLVARVVLVTAFFLILAQAMLGRGALYSIAKNVAALGALIVAWRLISAWRTEVAQTYLKFSPSGKLADLVRASQERSHSLLIVALAFVYVATRGLWIWLRDSALRFEQTRKALAYLFRRQLERQSKNQLAAPEPAQLPIALQAALTEDAACDAMCINHFPQLPQVLAIAEAAGSGGPGALIALAGDRGSGKTTWLMMLQQKLDGALPCTYHAFETRTPSAPEVCRLLSGILGMDETDDPAHLIAQAQLLSPRVILLDLGQNLMLRAVGGLSGYELFIRVAQATAGNIVWVIAFARWPFEFLQRTHPGRDVYHHVIHLAAWSEQEIGNLIDSRMQMAGFTADYDHLLLNMPTLATPRLTVTAAAEEDERTADRYNRLIWDYSDGNPRVALHFFRQSLHWSNGTCVTVRLFQTPALNELEEFGVRTHFILACLLQHENLTAEEAARSLCFPVHECAHALLLLHTRQFLVCEENGRYRITCHWSRAALRFLQRKKLLVV